jgi:hypothetical protein
MIEGGMRLAMVEAEAISAADAQAGARVFLRFIENFQPKTRA